MAREACVLEHTGFVLCYVLINKIVLEKNQTVCIWDHLKPTSNLSNPIKWLDGCINLNHHYRVLNLLFIYFCFKDCIVGAFVEFVPVHSCLFLR